MAVIIGPSSNSPIDQADSPKIVRAIGERLTELGVQLLFSGTRETGLTDIRTCWTLRLTRCVLKICFLFDFVPFLGGDPLFKGTGANVANIIEQLVKEKFVKVNRLFSLSHSLCYSRKQLFTILGCGGHPEELTYRWSAWVHQLQIRYAFASWIIAFASASAQLSLFFSVSFTGYSDLLSGGHWGGYASTAPPGFVEFATYLKDNGKGLEDFVLPAFATPPVFPVAGTSIYCCLLPCLVECKELNVFLLPRAGSTSLAEVEYLRRTIEVISEKKGPGKEASVTVVVKK